MGLYHDLYSKADVLSLSDVFGVCREYYGLDLCHYFRRLGSSWDAMLKMTGVALRAHFRH